MGCWQVVAVMVLGLSAARGQQPDAALAWQPLKVTESAFPADIGMLDSEREEYAGHLVAVAIDHLRSQKASPASLGLARRMIALALHLSPRNKRAIVANFQLAKGMIPEAVAMDLQAASFVRLLVARGQLLDKQPGKDNRLLSRYMFQLAAELDPKNEDAVYLSELQRIEHGAPEWELLTEAKPAAAP